MLYSSILLCGCVILLKLYYATSSLPKDCRIEDETRGRYDASDHTDRTDGEPMGVLETHIEPKSEEFIANRDAMAALVTELREREAIIRAGGGADAIAKHRKRKKMLARERIGLAVVPTIVVRDELEARVLVEIAPLPELKETFFAITLARRFPNPLLNVLIRSPR